MVARRSLLLACIVAAAACQAVAPFDESLIPSAPIGGDVGKAGTGGSGGLGGTSGSDPGGHSAAAGESGQAGAGGGNSGASGTGGVAGVGGHAPAGGGGTMVTGTGGVSGGASGGTGGASASAGAAGGDGSGGTSTGGDTGVGVGGGGGGGGGVVCGKDYVCDADTATSKATGLRWRRRHDPPADWTTAIGECEMNYGASWRLPSEKNLKTIVDTDQAPPVIDKVTFLNMPTDSAFFWTADSLNGSVTYISFADGTEGATYPTGMFYVRCVEGP